MKTWKCLTICQPYASLIMSGAKRVENRRWPIGHRGPLLIHAGKSREWLDSWDGPLPDPMPMGAIIGWVRVTACLTIEQIRLGAVPPALAWVRHHQHATGPHCWVLEDPRRAPDPIPYRGVLGLFDVPDAVVAPLRMLDS